MRFVPRAFHPTRRAATLFGVPVTAETYKPVLYDYNGSIYRPSGLASDYPEMRATYRCTLCGAQRTRTMGRHAWWYPWPGGSNGCHHLFKVTGVEVRVLRPDGTVTWRRPWLLRTGDRVYTSTVRIHESGWSKPKGSVRIALCRRLPRSNSQGNRNGWRDLPLHMMRTLYGLEFGNFLAKI